MDLWFCLKQRLSTYRAEREREVVCSPAICNCRRAEFEQSKLFEPSQIETLILVNLKKLTKAKKQSEPLASLAKISLSCK